MQWFGEVIPVLGNLLLRLPSLVETHYETADQLANKRNGKLETGLRLLASQISGTVYLSQVCRFVCYFI